VVQLRGNAVISGGQNVSSAFVSIDIVGSSFIFNIFFVSKHKPRKHFHRLNGWPDSPAIPLTIFIICNIVGSKVLVAVLAPRSGQSVFHFDLGIHIIQQPALRGCPGPHMN
jgi:hypothetical protein